MSDSIADDTIVGVAGIAVHIGKTERQTFYLLEKRQLPGFKLSGKWHLRKSTYARHIEKLEAASQAAAA